jgi:mRNA interferase MazF
MPSTTSFSQGDVVLVPFPFTDLSAIKQRPALVLSPERLNKGRPDLVVAAITSQIQDVISEDEILLSDSDLKTAGLPKPSIIKLGKIFTIHQGLIRKKLGPRARPNVAKHLAEAVAIDAMKTKAIQRRYRAPKRSACAMCKPHQQGRADKNGASGTSDMAGKAVR